MGVRDISLDEMLSGSAEPVRKTGPAEVKQEAGVKDISLDEMLTPFQEQAKPAEKPAAPAQASPKLSLIQALQDPTIAAGLVNGSVPEGGVPEGGLPIPVPIPGLGVLSLTYNPQQESPKFMEWLAQEQEPAKDFTDWYSRVLPVSMAKLPPAMAKFFLHDVARPFTDAVFKELFNNPNAAKYDPNDVAQMDLSLPFRGGDLALDLGKAVYNTIEGFARFSGEPIGVYGWEAMKHRWLTDPAGAVLGLAPFAPKLREAVFKTGEKKAAALKAALEEDIAALSQQDQAAAAEQSAMERAIRAGERVSREWEALDQAEQKAAEEAALRGSAYEAGVRARAKKAARIEEIRRRIFAQKPEPTPAQPHQPATGAEPYVTAEPPKIESATGRPVPDVTSSRGAYGQNLTKEVKEAPKVIQRANGSQVAQKEIARQMVEGENQEQLAALRARAQRAKETGKTTPKGPVTDLSERRTIKDTEAKIAEIDQVIAKAPSKEGIARLEKAKAALLKDLQKSRMSVVGSEPTVGAFPKIGELGNVFDNPEYRAYKKRIAEWEAKIAAEREESARARAARRAERQTQESGTQASREEEQVIPEVDQHIAEVVSNRPIEQSETSPFRQTPEETAQKTKLYENRDELRKALASADEEAYIAYRLHEANRWLDGDDSVDIGRIREDLLTRAASAGQHDVHRVLKNEAADWVQKLERPGTGSGVKLRSGIGPEDLSDIFNSVKFKQWFGKSKVVDEDGNPLTVYHGTSSDFDTFDSKEVSKISGFTQEKGFYFSRDPEHSAGFSGNYEGGKGRLMPVHLRIENPYVVDDSVIGYLSPKRVAELKAKGYDGAIARDEFVVWNPNQIKSVWNSGEYGDTGNILHSGIGPGAFKVFESHKRARQLDEPSLPKRLRELYNSGKVNFIDPAGPLRKEFEKLGKEGYQAEQALSLSRGGTGRAKVLHDQLDKAVYRGLDKAKHQALDDLIFSTRTAEIAGYNPKAIKEAGITPEENAQYLRDFQKLHKLSDVEYRDLQVRMGRYFDAMKASLKRGLDEGLIDQELFDKLKGFNYSRRQLIDKLDPVRGTEIGKRKLLVRDSGVDWLADDSKGGVLERDSRLLAGEVILRMENRIAKNRANKALHDLAVSQPDNPIVKIRRKGETIPPGWEKIDLFIDGQRRSVHMVKEFANQWILNEKHYSSQLSEFIRWASGSPLLKFSATGANLGFALAQLPKDIGHIFTTSQRLVDGKWQDTYSPFFPKALFQMGSDLAATFADTFLRKGAYLDAVEDGMMMDFLTSQGMLFKKKTRLDYHFERLQEILAYPGMSTELWSRLALRNRVLRQWDETIRKAPEAERAELQQQARREASYIARDYLDFAVGGGFTKAIDLSVPYLNAGVQASRGIWRAAGRNPVSFGAKVLQLAGVSMLTYWAMHSVNPEATKQIRDSDMEQNLAFPIGPKFTDEHGVERHAVVKIPLDHSQRFFKRAFDYLAAKAVGEEVDPTSVVHSLTALLPTNEYPSSPTAKALIGYFLNKDFWSRRDITNMDVDPSAQYTPNKTHPVLAAVGEATAGLPPGMQISPDRLQYAINQFMTQGNEFSYLTGQAWKEAFGRQPGDIQEKALAMWMHQVPTFGRFVSFTDPGRKATDEAVGIKQDVSTKRFVENRNFDMLVEEYLYGTGVSQKQVEDYVKQFDKPTQERLEQRYETHRRAQALTGGDRNWWIVLSGMTPEARAKTVWKRLDKMTPEQMAQFQADARIMSHLFGKEFDEQWGRLRRGEVE